MNEKQIAILEECEKLFATKGFEASSVREIAGAAGVNIAMISYYFGSKEHLMEALFKYRMEASRLRVENIIRDAQLRPFEKVETLIRDYVTKVVNNQNFYKIMLSEQVLRQNPVIIRLIKELKMGYANLTESILQEGQKERLFKDNIDIILLMNTMTGTVTQLVINQDQFFEYHNYKLTAKEKKEILTDRLFHHLRGLFRCALGYVDNRL